jgi:hypothetical protein
MLVSFKNINNKVNNYEVNPEDNLSSVVSKLLEDNKIDPDKNTIKFIFKGQILNHEKLFSEFTEENLVIIFMASKIKPEVAPKTISNTSSINSVVQTSQLNNESTSSVNVQPLSNLFNQSYISESDENLDLVDKLRAAVIGTLVFIRTNPQLAELFNNNFEILIGVMTSNQVRPLFEKMVSETSDSDSEYLDELSESLINVNSDEQSIETTNQDSPLNSIELTQDDINNINTLVSLGFSKQDVIQAYIFCNKNIDMAASMLMDS